MNWLRSKWKTITLITLVASYIVCIFILDKRVDYFYMTAYAYIIITALLFLGTIIGAPGLLLHGLLKKEKLALPFYSLAIKLGTANTNILTAYGLVMLRSYHPDKALKVFEHAKAQSKHFFYKKTLSANIALCHWKLGDTQLAAQMYEDILYYPDLPEITDFSLDNLDEGESKNGNFFPQDFITLAFLNLLNHDTDKALYFTHVGLRKSEKYGPAYDNLGQIAYAQGDFTIAKDYFNQGLDCKPGMTDSIYYLALIAYEENDLEKAQSILETLDTAKINGLSTITLENVTTLKKKLSH